LTPSGNKRDSMSFIPFFGGRRVCLGKSFAEIVTKIVGPSIIGSFDFELVNKEFYQNEP
jgi:cytochrome P450